MDGKTIAIVAGLGLAGAAAPLAVAYGAGALVPWAMSTFGTVVPGVGTLHAVGGVAATLQYTSVALVSAKAAVIGGASAIGAVAGWKKL